MRKFEYPSTWLLVRGPLKLFHWWRLNCPCIHVESVYDTSSSMWGIWGDSCCTANQVVLTKGNGEKLIAVTFFNEVLKSWDWLHITLCKTERLDLPPESLQSIYYGMHELISGKLISLELISWELISRELISRDDPILMSFCKPCGAASRPSENWNSRCREYNYNSCIGLTHVTRCCSKHQTVDIVSMTRPSSCFSSLGMRLATVVTRDSVQLGIWVCG